MTDLIKTVDDFIDALSKLRFENTFNPYAEICPDHDSDDAAFIRRRNLQLVLESALSNGIDSIWIARDLGYRGGRRTGLALTDELHLPWHATLLGTPPLMRATKGPLMAERTAGVVWHMLRTINRPVFLWNVFPLHPHVPDDPLSNRNHTRRERVACSPLLAWLIDRLKPRTIVAIGRDAQVALKDSGFPIASVRHPSYGGQTDFIETLASLYGLSHVPRTHLSQGILF